MFTGNGCFYIIQVNNENTKLTIETSEFRDSGHFNFVFVNINKCNCVVFVDFESFFTTGSTFPWKI